jgi:hypothetical protein
VADAIPASERSAHVRLIADLFTSQCEERTELENGYGFRFPAESLESLARFVSNERKCCPFLHIRLDVAPADGPVWLQLTGPEGTRDVLKAELTLGPSCGCGG